MRNLQLLTGTPVNKPLDAYAYVKLKSPGLYRNLDHFENIHVEARDFFKRPVKWGNLDLLKTNLELASISRTKEEVHGYRTEALFPDWEYDLAPEHMALYEKLVDEQLLIFDDGSMIDATSMQKLRHALQQVVVNLDHFANDPKLRSVSYDMIDRAVEEVGTRKLLIWTNYKRTSRSVMSYLQKLVVAGAYSEVDSEKGVDRFMSDDSTRILVAQYQSAGAGLNPQHVCSDALFLELSTVPLYMRQAMGRIDRLGQTKVPVQRFAVASRTVQVGLLQSLLANDDLVHRIEPTKKAIRAALMGE